MRRRAWMFMVGVAILGGVGGYVLGTTGPPQHYLVVWIKPGAPVASDLTMLRELQVMPGVNACYYWSQLDDYHEAASAILTPSELPASIRCVTRTSIVGQQVRKNWTNRDDVYEVTLLKPMHLVAP